ncbi:hypothetical protein K432DRAFT_342938 [Lepidopterella palustris CBS 459.81]|uniref:Tat pathway signal sequence n=1 Tax=Lepidopterella palustris CBS 459.81 TaxID=1314670 RepID=A0A8E2EK95_9PEZI|nr:hypothetical protein K432DRAFT_342938 [Lepidopterella palustris CBS 459.81]
MPSKYSSLPQHGRISLAEDSESEAAMMVNAGFEKQDRYSRPARHQIAGVIHWIAHGVSVILIIGLILIEVSRKSMPAGALRASGLTVWTPAKEYLGDVSHMSVFQNSFWQYSPYKGPPTEQVIARWDHLTHTGPLNLTAEEMAKLGHSLDAVQYPPEFGGGYIGYLESAHQIHCLYALWEDHHFRTHPELFPNFAMKLRTQPNITEWHFEHCVDVLRNRLMCTADDQIVTFRWVKGVSGPYPYFNTKHECRDYEALLEWDEERRADKNMLEGYKWPVPEDAVKLTHAP